LGQALQVDCFFESFPVKHALRPGVIFATLASADVLWPIASRKFFPENGSYSVKRIFAACSEKRVFQRPAVFFLSVQLLFRRTGPRSWTANGQRLFRSSSEPRTKLLALERGTWAQRAGTDLPILSENGEPLTVNVVFHQRSAYSGSSSVQRFLAREAELAFAKQRLARWSRTGH